VGLHQAQDVVAIGAVERGRGGRPVASCHGAIDQIARQRGQAGQRGRVQRNWQIYREHAGLRAADAPQLLNLRCIDAVIEAVIKVAD
jgi:hypothetical protein